MLTIFYGRENVDKEKFIFDNIDPKARALIIVPDQFTLEAERELFAHFGVQSMMNIEVLSMSRLGSRLLAELGGSKRTFIDKYGRHMILSQVASEERENLQVFRGLESRSSFIDMVNNFISELKQYNCGVAELEQIAFNPGLVYLMDDFSSLPALPQQLIQPLTTYVSGGVEEVPLAQPGKAL